MPITNERVAKLREFGFSELAARTYLALLDLGTSEVRDICKVSNVPSSKIYHILDQLQEKGLATMLPEFPRRYAPVAFEEYLDRLHREYLQSANDIERDRQDLATLFPILGTLDVSDRGGFTVLRGRRNVLDKVHELLRGATHDWLALGTPLSPQRQSRFMTDYVDAKERGVRLRMLSPVTKENLEVLTSFSTVAQIRAREIETTDPAARVAFFIADGSRALLVTYDPDDANLYTGKDVGIFTDHDAMVKALVAIVESHWHLSPPFQEQRPEVEHGRAPDLTRVYTTEKGSLQAMTDAVARGVRECLHMSTVPLSSLPQCDVLSALEAGGTKVRALLNLSTLEEADRVAAELQANPDLEVRHLDPRVFTHFTLLDGREAFFSLGRPDLGDPSRPGVLSDLFIHTTNAQTVAGLKEHFEELWAKGVPLAERRAGLSRTA